MAKWSQSMLAGFDRAVQGIRANPAAGLARPRPAPPAPTPAIEHGYQVIPAIGFAAVASREGCRFELRRRSLASGREESLDLDHRDVAALTWTIKVANRKRSRSRLLDPGIQTLSGRGRRVELARPGGAAMPASAGRGIRSLGLATTDAAGNLIVFAAEGHAVEDAEGEWFDDDCDGWVRAELQLRSGQRVLAARIASAWFVATTGEFAIPEGRVDPDEFAPGALTQAIALRRSPAKDLKA
ncbi:MAG TPA: LodA/GoxA family CTQ-dependent oxidase [Enhygromyxa sp.]|nr:LodA/GoxA family CTQ-dependent oxidase [Enhygromyxa sp.]